MKIFDTKFYYMKNFDTKKTIYGSTKFQHQVIENFEPSEEYDLNSVAMYSFTLTGKIIRDG